MNLKQLASSSLTCSIASIGVLLLALLLLKTHVLPEKADAVIRAARNAGFNEADLEVQTRNYYREVADVDIGRFAGFGKFLGKMGLKETAPEGPEQEQALAETSIVHRENLYLPWELKPNESINFRGHPFSTNRWGMRDRDYELHKPADTFRMAVVGASNTMGYGVAVEDGYVELIEDRLNAEFAGKAWANYEFMNFSVGGYDLSDRLFVATEKVPQFQPDVIFVVLLDRDLRAQVYQRVAERLSNSEPLHYEFLEKLAAEAGANPGDRLTKLQQRLRPYRASLIKGCAEELRRLQERTGVPVVVIALNLFAGEANQDLVQGAEICEGAGVPVVRVFDAYVGYTGEQVYTSPTDRHPVPLGHRLIAEELYSILLEHPVIGPMIRAETRKDAAAHGS